jgi:outer membrane PBP1 activator LpoA protein
MRSLRALIFAWVVAAALAGCQTAGPAANSGTYPRKPNAQTADRMAQARKSDAATPRLLMGVGF